MDNNKNEALRAKSIAEGKFEQSDYIGAKRFALIAQNLYPELDGIAHMLSTLDVFISAENKINGETDWYGVLGVDPSIDDAAMKKQFKKMALMVHPDKNKFVGADGAFKLISESWSLLSDKEKRLAYDGRREFKLFGQKFSVRGADPSMQSTQNQHFKHNDAPSASEEKWSSRHTAYPSSPLQDSQFFGHSGYNSSANPTSEFQKKSGSVPFTSSSAPSYQSCGYFWTTCQSCNVYYEYSTIFINQTLHCRSCHKSFMALEVAPPRFHEN